MYQSILEYIVNADLCYRLAMVASMANDSDLKDDTKIYSRENWMPELVGQFNDVRDVPASIRTANGRHLLDSNARFHTGNKHPTINIDRMELSWNDNDGSEPPYFNTMRAVGPCRINFDNLKFWHHQDSVHRRRGDAIICDMVTFIWNTKKNKNGTYRENGPYQIVIKGFRAEYNMGVAINARHAHLGVSWGGANGIRLGEEKVQAVINNNDIGVNYLMVDSCFADDGEDFIFWDEIGRAQDIAAA